MLCRPISSTYLNPSETNTPTGVPLPSRMALVAMVVPWNIRRTCEYATLFDLSISEMPDHEAAGRVVGCGGCLEEPHAPGGQVKQNNIGKGPTHVDCQGVFVHLRKPHSSTVSGRVPSRAGDRSRLVPLPDPLMPPGGYCDTSPRLRLQTLPTRPAACSMWPSASSRKPMRKGCPIIHGCKLSTIERPLSAPSSYISSKLSRSMVAYRSTVHLAVGHGHHVVQLQHDRQGE